MLDIERLSAIIITGAAVITAIITVIKYISRGAIMLQKWNDTEKKLEELNTDLSGKIQEIKAEQCMLTYCMLATLDGLKQLGANGKVTEARAELDKFLNKQAHDLGGEK